MRRGPELIAFAASFVIFAIMTAPGVTWMDSGELAAAAFTLGGAHPPGHPAHTLAGKLAALVPVGEVAYRVALLSAATMAAAVAGVVALARALVPGGVAAGLVAAGLATLSPVVQLNATRVEVYAPAAALLVWALVALVRFVRPRAARDRDARLVAAAALAWGLAAALQPAIALAAGAPMAAFALASARSRLGRLVPVALGLAGLGMAAYLYLPVRAHAASPPLLLWGEPGTASGLATLLFAPAYRDNFALAGLVERLAGLAFLCGEGLGAGLFWGGLAGLGFAALTGLRGAGLVLCTAVSVLVGAATQRQVNPDMPGYVLAGLLVLGVGLAPLAAAVQRALPAGVTAARHVVAVIVLLPVAGLGLGAPVVRAADAGPRRGDDALRWWSDTVERMPPGPGVYFADHDWSLFAAQYERLVAQGRPDIALANRELARDRWFLAHLARALPALYVPYIHDGVRGSTAARLAAVNLRHGRPVGGDEPARELPDAVPMGRAFLYRATSAETQAAAAIVPVRPPPRYHGDTGRRVSGAVAMARAEHDLERGRLAGAAVAAGLAERFGEPGLAALRAASRRPGPLLHRLVPRLRSVILHEPWQAELLGDELAWQAGLDAPDPDGLVAERRLHAGWRRVLARPPGALPAEVADIAALGPDAEMATAQMLVAHGRDRDAEAWLRDMLRRRGPDHRTLVLLGSIVGNRGGDAALAAAEALFAQAVDLAPGRARAEALVRLGVAQAKRDRRTEAAASWRRALAIDPGRSDAATLLDRLPLE